MKPSTRDGIEVTLFICCVIWIAYAVIASLGIMSLPYLAVLAYWMLAIFVLE